MKNEELNKILYESELGFRSLVENAFLGIAISDLKGRLVYVNKALADLAGYSINELQDQPFKKFIHPDDRGRVIRLFFHIMLLKRSLRSLEFRSLRKDGRVLTLWSKPSRFIVNGKTIGFQAIVVDITELKEMDKELRQTNRKLETILETAMEGIATVDPEENFVFVNKAFAEMLGYKENELQDINIRKLVDEVEYRKIRKETAKRRRGEISRYELILKRKDGTPCIVQVSASPLWNEDGTFAGALAIVMDITERKQMEERLRESENRLRCLIEYAPEAIYMNDLYGRFIDGNRQAEILTGYKREELIGKTLLECKLLPEKYFPKIIEALEKNKRGEKFGPSEFELTRKDGTTVIVEISSFPVKRSGKVEVIGIARDVTERGKAEEALRKSENKYRTLLENLPQKIFFKDKDSVYIACNENYARDLKIHSDMITGKTDYDFYPKRLAEKYRADDKRIMNSRKTEDIEEEYIQDGRKVFVHTVKIPIKDENSNVVGILGIFWDITERKRMEEALRESEEKFRNIFENANDCLVFLDTSGNILNVNKRTVEVFGGTKEEILGKHFTQISGISSEEMSEMISIFKGIFEGKDSYLKMTIKNRKGQERRIEGSLSIIRVNGQITGILAVARDVTEKEQMQRKLEEYSQELERLVEQRTKQLKEAQERLIKTERLAAIGEVAAMVGHDLRNPLTGISGATYYLKTKLGPTADKKVLEVLRLIDAGVNHANCIINDLLDYSREIRLELTEESPKSIIKKALGMIKIPDNVEILDFSRAEPKAEVDSGKMNRVFSNIIKNAIDAMPDGGKLTITSKESNGNLEMSFTDTGIGMPREVLQKIWIPFFTTKARGMGLGLPICKKIIEAHKGEITVKSEVGKGTTFTITIPRTLKTKGGEKTWVNVPESLLSTTTKA